MEKKSKLHIGWLVTAMVVVLLVIDQIIKVYIKTHFCLGESVRVTDWFYIEFVENNGMAWGMSFIGKFWLSLLRLVAICALSIYLHRIIKRGTYRLLYIILVSLVLTGAIGNMIDSILWFLHLWNHHRRLIFRIRNERMKRGNLKMNTITMLELAGILQAQRIHYYM